MDNETMNNETMNNEAMDKKKSALSALNRRHLRNHVSNEAMNNEQ